MKQIHAKIDNIFQLSDNRTLIAIILDERIPFFKDKPCNLYVNENFLCKSVIYYETMGRNSTKPELCIIGTFENIPLDLDIVKSNDCYIEFEI